VDRVRDERTVDFTMGRNCTRRHKNLCLPLMITEALRSAPADASRQGSVIDNVAISLVRCELGALSRVLSIVSTDLG
jgi:hypothetical protein